MSISKRHALAALLATPFAFVACAQLLSYDDYSARPEVAPDTGNKSDVSTEVSDTADAPEGPIRPPLRPAGDPVPSGKGRTLWFAIKRMYLGSLTSLGAETPDAWKEWGYDLDKVCTSVDDSKANIGTCKRPPDAVQDSLMDGTRCRDNNFGRHVVALLKLSSAGFESRLNEGLLEGGDTWLLRIDDVDDGVDDPYAPGKLYRSTSMSGTAKWDGTDVREVLSDSLTGPSLEKPRTAFDRGYIKDHVWVSGDPELRSLLLPVSNTVIVPLTLDSTVMTLELNAAHTAGGRATLVGAIPIKTIDTLLVPVAAGAGFCPGSGLYTSLYNSMQRFPDVVIGAPNLQDTTLQCDGISLGLGLDVGTIQPVTKIVDPPPPKPDPCDGGTGG